MEVTSTAPNQDEERSIQAIKSLPNNITNDFKKPDSEINMPKITKSLMRALMNRT